MLERAEIQHLLSRDSLLLQPALNGRICVPFYLLTWTPPLLLVIP